MGKALLVTDVQRDFFAGDAMTASAPMLAAAVARLLAGARAARVPIVHVHSLFEPDGSDWMPHHRQRGVGTCVVGTPGAEVLPWAAPQPGEEVIVKKRFSAFFQTTLKGHLDVRGIETVYLAGVFTHVCIRATALDAYQHGLIVVVVEDAVGANVAAQHHDTLAFLPLIARVAPVETVVGEWAAHPGR